RQRLDAGLVGDLLVGDDAGNGGGDFHDSRGMVWVSSKKMKMLTGGFEVHQGAIFGVLSHLERAFRSCSMVEENFGSVELYLSQLQIHHRFGIVGVSAGNIPASNLE